MNVKIPAGKRACTGLVVKGNEECGADTSTEKHNCLKKGKW